MLTCREVTEASTAYREGALPWPRRLEMRLHLAICRGCRAHLRQVGATLAALGKLPPAQVGRQGMERALGAFRAWRGGTGAGR